MNATKLLTLLIWTMVSAQQVCLATERARLDCGPDFETNRRELGDDCTIIKRYNSTEINHLIDGGHEAKLLATIKQCTCELAAMTDLWAEAFNLEDQPETQRLSIIVQDKLNSKGNETFVHPNYLWSDIEVVVYKISIHTAAKDYFEQQAHNSSKVLSPKLRQVLQRNPIWTIIRTVCRRVANDSHKLYRYLENLNRISATAFFDLINSVEGIDMIYQASKACKLLIMRNLHEYKVKPDSIDFVPVDPEPSWRDLTVEDNSISRDIDVTLRDSSAHLLDCAAWQRDKLTLPELAKTCPMMMSEKVPMDWIKDHPYSTDRSDAAIRCGCQLLLHNSTWEAMMQDRNVNRMSQALTDYLNRAGIPNFNVLPIWSIHGWFEEAMSRFRNNRKMSIKELIKSRRGAQDPLTPSNRPSAETEIALETLRRGCNYIVFNYNKGSRQTSELKLIKYLDNLQVISQDPMFVFHLTLQDTNLFKLHALSQMCEPFVK